MPDLKPTIQYPDFAKLDIRVGTIIEAVDVVESEKLLRLRVDFGIELGERIIFAGIKRWYKPEELVGVQTTFLANLAPKPMPGGESQGMLLAADGEEGRPVLLQLNGPAANGSVLM